MQKKYTESTNNNNYYKILYTEPDEQTGASVSKQNKKGSDPFGGAQSNSQHKVNTGTDQREERTSWCPPIFATGVSSKDLLNIISKSKFDFNNIKFEKKGFGKLKIFVREVELHSLLLEQFKINKIEAFSFTPKENKKYNIVLKGLSGEFSPEEILKEISLLEPSLRVAVKQFETKWSKESGIPLDLFLCALEDRESIIKLKSIKFLLRHRVKWESVKSVGMRQCFRCQRFGHVAMYCSFVARCVKCLIEHEVGKCELGPKSETSIAPCVNCKAPGHPANFRGCPKRAEYLKRKESTIRPQNIKQSLINSNVSFATAARSAMLDEPKPQPKTQQSPAMGCDVTDFLKESQNLFGVPIGELISKIRAFWPKYQKLSQNEKPGAYLWFIASLSP